jgi:hypothetical protein
VSSSVVTFSLALAISIFLFSIIWSKIVIYAEFCFDKTFKLGLLPNST